MTFPSDDSLVTKLTKSGAFSGYSADDAATVLNWARAARKTRPVLFVGAGLTLNADPAPGWREVTGSTTPPKAMSWKGLADYFKSSLAADGEADEADPLWLAQLYSERYSPEALYRFLKDKAVPDARLEPSAIYRPLFELDWECILTTNYDTLLERAHRKFEIPGGIVTVCSDRDLARSAGQRQSTEIIHLHGVLDRPETIVLTLEQYRRYPVDHPGMTARVRQLFLQHPVLLIGFGGADPNFVHWSGWVRDLVGEHKNPWLMLDYAAKTSHPRRSYWRHQLHFITVGHEAYALKLEHTLRAVAKFTREVPPNELKEYAEDLMRSSGTINDLLNNLDAGLWMNGEAVPSAMDRHNRTVLAGVALEVYFRLRYPDEHDAKWRKITAATKEFIRVSPTQQVGENGSPAMSRPEQLAIFRAALGASLMRFIRILASHRVYAFNCDHLRITVRDELELLTQSSIENNDTRAHMLFLSLRAKIEENITDEDGSVQRQIEDAIAQVPASQAVHEETQAMLDELKIRQQVWSGQVPKIESSNDHPQRTRMMAFIASLKCDIHTSAQLYCDAATLSREKCEDPVVEWLTITSALVAGNAAYWAKGSPRHGSILRPEVVDRLKERQEWLTRDNKRIEEFNDDILRATRKSFDRLADGNEDAQDATRDSARIIMILERHWCNPWVAGEQADICGFFHWQQGSYTIAIQLLSRYGSKKLGPLLQKHVSKPFTPRLPLQVISELLRAGRWSSEWVSKAEALGHTVDQFTESEIEEASRWCRDASTLNSEQWIPRGGSLQHVHGTVFLVLQFKLCRYRAYSYFNELWRQSLPAFRASWLDTKEILLSVWPELPWALWLAEKQATSNQIEEVFAEAFELCVFHKGFPPLSSVISFRIGLAVDGPLSLSQRFLELLGSVTDVEAVLNSLDPSSGYILTYLTQGSRRRKLIEQALVQLPRGSIRSVDINHILFFVVILDIMTASELLQLEEWLLGLRGAQIEERPWREPLPFLAQLISAFIRSDSCSSARSQDLLVQILKLRCAQSVKCIQHAGALPPRLLSKIAPDFENLVDNLLRGIAPLGYVDSPDCGEEAIRWGVGFINVWSTDGRKIPTKWWTALIYLPSAHETLTSQIALRVIRMMLDNPKRKSLSVPDRVVLIDGLLASLRDGRARVAGYAVRCMVVLQATAPDVRVERRLRELEVDSRSEIVLAFKMANAGSGRRRRSRP